MLYKRVEHRDTSVQFLAVHALCWDETMGSPTCGFIVVDPETTHEDLVHLKRIAQRAREELERAKPGSAVWEAMRFILSSPIEKAQEELTWSDYIDYPEPDQTYGAADG